MSFSFDQNTEQNTTDTTLKAMAIKRIVATLNFCYQNAYTTSNCYGI